MGKGGATNSVGVCGGGNSGRTYLGNDGPPPEGEGGVLGYWSGGSGIEGMRGGYKLNSE